MDIHALHFTVKKAQISENSDKISSFVVFKFGDYHGSTAPIQGTQPQWNKTFDLERNLVRNDSVAVVELWSKGFLWDKLLGVSVIPVSSMKENMTEAVVLYSNLVVRENGPLDVANATKHLIWIDAMLEHVERNKKSCENQPGGGATEGFESGHISSDHKPIPETSVREKKQRKSLEGDVSEEDGKDGVELNANISTSQAKKISEFNKTFNKSDRCDFTACQLRRSFHYNPDYKMNSSRFRKASATQVSKLRWTEAIVNLRRKEPHSEEDKKINKMIIAVDLLLEKNQFYSTIEKAPDLKLPRRTSMAFIEPPPTKSKRGHCVSVFKKFTTHSEELRKHVYMKALQAILYPVSDSTPHKMVHWTATSPSYCQECEGLLWGVAKQGVRCSECGVRTHDKCKDLLNADCLQRATEKSLNDGENEKTTNLMNVIKERMRARLESKLELFDCLRKVFKVDPESHRRSVEEAKNVILDGTCRWLAKLEITVICARGLAIKDKTGASDPYVTVQVGKVKKKTKTVYQDINPVWDETFHFECQNSTDRIKIRVWDEDDDLKSFVRSKFTAESDDFLGQKMIDVHTLASETELWFNLEKRTERSSVSGSIQLRINVEIKGEEKVAPYHAQYSHLHDNLFQFLADNNQLFFRLPDLNLPEDWKIYFDPVSQEVIDEFARRYGIESIFQAMTQFSHLCEKYTEPGVLVALNCLLEQINEFYAPNVPINSLSAKERLVSSNFGKSKFVKVLDNLYNSLRIDLSMYRNNYQSTDATRLLDLKASINILKNINFFRAEVQEVTSSSKLCEVIETCVRACIESTYQYVFNHCAEMYAHQFEDVEVKEEEEDGDDDDTEDGRRDGEESPGCKKNLIFWQKLLTLMVSTIDEDVTVYYHIFNQFSQEFDLEQLSALVQWECLCSDLKYVLEEHQLESRCRSCEYVNLHIRVNEFYNKFVLSTNPSAEQPEYPLWFEPLILRWMEENHEMSLSFATGAYMRDKGEQFQKASKCSLFSCSVTDVFTQLNQCFTVVTILVKPHRDAGKRYNLYFTSTIEKVLLAYSNHVKEDFLALCIQPEIACRLMNNIQQLRVELEKLYLVMGGEKLDIEITYQLNSLQQKLSNCLNQLISTFCQSLNGSVVEKILEMKELLAQQPNQGADHSSSSQRNTIINESNRILRPLIDYLDVSLSTYAQQCERTVLKRLLKEIWKAVLKEMENTIILPPLARSRRSLNLTPRQCTTLEMVLDTLKQFFWANNHGLRKSYLEKTESYLGLMDALFMFTQSTDILIKAFIESQSFQIVAVADINWPSTSAIFQPYVQVNMLGPDMSARKRNESTKAKSSTWSPKFNEVFTFTLGNNPEMDFYELHICLKDYCFARDDKLIGVTVYQMKEFTGKQKGSCACWLPFKRCVHVDEVGNMVLKILHQRTNDDIAREFVKLKTEMRDTERQQNGK